MPRARFAYHEPRGNPCDCGVPWARHRVRHEPGCQCGLRHKGSRSPSDSKRTHALRRFTVGLDGEGEGRDPHRYTLLAWSDASGRRTAHVADERGLSTERCLRFLFGLPVHARPFGFFLSYDWTKILADLPDALLYRLFRPETRRIPHDEGGGFTWIRWCGWKLHYQAGMVRIKRGKRCLTVWDVGKFFQTTFVRALEAWNVGSAEERERIAAMKAQRGEFEHVDRARVREYCLAECRLLAELVAKLGAAHEAAGLHLRSWHGPGSSASALLRRMGIKDKRGDIPEEVQAASASAFFGGRFEHSTVGEIDGPIFGYDIVSAYPAQCVALPCLEHARWVWTTKEAATLKSEQACVRFALRATKCQRSWGPLPCRMSNGTILYPRSGFSGWTWLAEYRAAKAWPQVEFRGAWILKRNCDCQPFALVRDLFDERNRVGRKTGPGMALKLAINSVYGKLAQSVGDPPFRSQVWAGMITSGTRAMLLDVLRRADADVLAVATDGVYTRRKVKLDVGEDLGQWEASEYRSIVLVRPGIYWTDEDVRSRGIPRTALSASQALVLNGLRSGATEVALPPLTQFGGARACVYRTRDGRVHRAARYGEWYERPARVSLSAAPKRPASWGLYDLPGVESAPYDPNRAPPETLALRASARFPV